MSPRLGRRRVLYVGGTFLGLGCVALDPEEENPSDDTGTNDVEPTPHGDPSEGGDDEDESGVEQPSNESEQEDPEDPPDEPVDIVGDFSDWEVIDGRVANGANPTADGTSSAHLVVDAEHVHAAIRRRFDRPRDLTGLHPHVALQSDRVAYPRIRLYDADGDYLEFRTALLPDVDFHYAEFGINQVVGAPDLTTIEEIRFSQHVGTGETAEFWLGDPVITERVDPGIVLIHFDDSLETDYTEAYPILDAHDMTASTFINPGYLGRTVGGSPRLSIDQLDALDRAGWDVCSHSMTHADLTAVDRATVQTEVGDAYQWLVDHGFEQGAEYFVYPYANYDQTAIDVVSDYHEVAFCGGWGALGRCQNPYLVPRALGDPSFEEAKVDIDRTVQYGGVTCLFYHELAGERLQAFKQTVEYLAERTAKDAISVSTVRQAHEQLLSD